MNPQLQPLIQLQSLDLRGSAIKEQRRKIPDRLQSAEQPLRDARQLLEKASARAEAATKARREREGELEVQEAQIDKMKGRVSEIKKNVEYQAHLFEIQMADKKKGEIEEKILLLMEEVEQQQKAVQEAKSRVAEAEAAFGKQKTELEALEARLAAELGELEEKRKLVEASADKSLLDRYNKLKNTRKDLAVAPIRGGICSGCRLQIEPQLVAEVKRSEKLLSCSYCQRILYWEEEPSAASESITKAAENLHEKV